MSNKNKGKEPAWLDEDPDEREASAKKQNDPYGPMTDYAKFHGRNSDKNTERDVPSKTANSRPSLAQFCGQYGMRFENNLAILDLHGMRLSSALEAVDRAINGIIDDKRIKKLRIITGRGSHSEDGIGVLARDIHPHVGMVFSKFIADMDESPGKLKLGRFPVKGHFDIRFK